MDFSDIWGQLKKRGMKLSVSIPITKPIEYPPDDKINIAASLEVGILRNLLKKALRFLELFPEEHLTTEELSEMAELKKDISTRLR
jgi:hypothetical protein